MEVKIGKKTYTLYFGFKFLKYINRHHSIVSEGVETRTGGMALLSAAYAMKDPEALLTSLKAATDTEASKPSNGELEALIEEKLADGTYDDFYDDLVAEIKKDLILSRAMGNVPEAMLKEK